MLLQWAASKSSLPDFRFRSRRCLILPAKYGYSGILFVVLCLSGFGWAQEPSRSQHTASVPSAEAAALHALVEQFFAAYAKKDLDGFRTLWSEKSPEFESRRQQMQQLFTAQDRIEVRNVTVGKMKVEGEKATVHVEVEMSAVEPKTGKAAAGLGKKIHRLECVQEAGSWKVKVWREGDAVEELAATLVAAKTEQERTALLEEEKELVTVELRQALIKQGEGLRLQGNYAQALSLYHLAQSIAEHIGDRAGTAHTLNNIGELHRLQGNYAEALEYQQKSLAVAAELGDKAGIIRALRDIGIVYGSQSNYTQGLESFQNSLAVAAELGDNTAIGRVLNNIGVVYKLQGNYTQALDSYQKSLALAEALGDKVGIARTLNNIGAVHRLQGNYTQGLEYCQKSLALEKELGGKAGIASTLTNIGNVHASQGNYAQALESYQRSLTLSEALGDKAGIANILNNIGLVHASQGNYAQALESYQRSLTLKEASRDKAGIAGTLNNIGSIHRLQGNYVQALESYRKSLALRGALSDQAGIARSLNNIGEIHRLQGNPAQALEFAERAATIVRQIGSPETLWQSRTTAGRAYRATDRPTQARQALEEAIATIETLRTQVAGGEQEQQRFFEDKLSPYHAIVELLVAQNNTSEALAYAERCKARVLLDVLHSGRANITKAMTDQEQEQEQRFKSELVSLNSQLSHESLRPQPDPARLTELKARLEKARLDYEAFQTSLYGAHPELKVQRGEAQPLKLEEAGDLLPDKKSALLEFVVADEKTYLFVLTQKGDGSQTTPDLKVYALEIQRKDLAHRAERFRQQLAKRDLGFRETASQLYDLLLKPAGEELQGKTRLVIVPDGALWELPFQALLATQNHYLIEDYAISYAPSLTVLREMVSLRSKRIHRSGVSPTLLAFGNPTLGKQTIERVQSVLMDEKLDPLPEAEKQVKTLAQLYGAKQSKIYVGPEAREERAKAEAGSYRMLHFATHGILNNASPMYSQLVLAQPEDNSQEDGLLEAWELMQLDLKADLVVLSACETARGRVGAGEGVIGLSWALFVAGTPTAAVSQWKVESASTTQLMVEFHRNLQSKIRNSKSQISKAEALRLAAVKLLRNNRYQHPFYWAGFVVVGDGF